jgi:outer membrane murein-binding lipoprotein Lpp
MRRHTARLLTAAALSALALAGCARSQKKDEAPAPATAGPTADADAERLARMRAQIAKIEMKPDVAFLSEEERNVVNLLIKAANVMSDIYRKQVSEEAAAMRAALAGAGDAARLELFDLHFGPWDSLDEDKPFYGEMPRPEGAGFYPVDMTKQEFEAWIAAHPADKEAFLSGYTVIRRDEKGGLKAIPYSQYYREDLERAASYLRQAAALSSNPSLKKLLTLRADAFLNDDYFNSEIAWMDLDGPIEVAIGPYEVYTDGLFGYKTAYEAFVTVKDPQASAALDKYKKYLPDMEANLPVPPEYKNFRRKFESPIAVVTQVRGGGDNVPGVQTIAFNLPNDERVREAKGAKKVLLDNVMAAKFDRILKPLAGHVLAPEQAKLLMQKYMGAETLFHELSHSLGPGVIVKNGASTTVQAELKELYSGIEEGKADVMGALNVLFMMQKNEMPVAEKENFLATYFAGLFRAMRFGIHEAHGKGAAFQYAYFKEQGAFAIDPASGKYQLDFARLEAAISALTAEVVMLQGDGDYARAKAFLEKYAVLDADAERIIASLSNIPVDIQPIYPEKI